MTKQIQLFSFYVALNLLTLFLSVYYQAQQPQMDYTACKQCDGKQYLHTYNYLRGETKEFQVKFPFHSRVFVPWAVSFWSREELSQGFWYFHLLFSLLTVNALVYLWTSMGIAWQLQAIGITWLLFHWVGIIRYNQYDWITVDVPLYFFQTLFLIFVVRAWYFGLVPLAIVATAQKESFIPILVLLVLWQVYNYLTHKSPISVWVVFALVAAVLSKELLTWFFPPLGSGNPSSLITLLFFIRETLRQPLDLVRLFAAFFVGFGAWAWLALKYLNSASLKQKNTILLLLYSLMFIAFGVLAGRDMTRIVFLGYPFIMTLILYLLHSQKATTQELLLAGGCSLPLLRLLSVINTEQDRVQDWLMEFAPMSLVSAWAVYAVVSFWIVQRGAEILKTLITPPSLS